MTKRLAWLLFLLVIGLALAACSPAATPSSKPTTQPVMASATPKPPEPTNPPVATRPPGTPTSAGAPRTPTSGPPPLATSTPQPTQVQPTQPRPTPQVTVTAWVEKRMLELEWPLQLRLGESDLVRLALVPYLDSYVVQAEFPEHPVQTQSLPVERPPGFTLYGVARLDGVGFEISPSTQQEHLLPAGELVSWRWTLTPRSAGRQRLAISLILRWLPEESLKAPSRETLVYGRGLEVSVTSLLGMSQSQAMMVGFIGLLAGVGLGMAALVLRIRPGPGLLRALTPNTLLVIESQPGMKLSSQEVSLLQALFGKYARLVLLNEFLSGYSGARTFLALPVHPDERRDALTIVKIGQRSAIQKEYENYEVYVKDRLPPITARIQHTPVTVVGSEQAALQYTFIAEPGRPPVSLRQSLLDAPDPDLLLRLFETFGPNWWMQRRACTFRLAQEYDRLLPPHYVIQPQPSKERSLKTLHESASPAGIQLQPGEMVYIGPFASFERRSDGASLTLYGKPQPGQPPLRLRWLGMVPPAHTTGRVMETRSTLLNNLTAGLELFDLPDPLVYLPDLLYESVLATQSTIHGDLNLENILVGPGGFVWLIDFAQTREGHPIFDFAHLEAEIIVQVLAARFNTAQEYLAFLQAGDDPGKHCRGDPLLGALNEIYTRCLLNPGQRREADLARCLACMGALKFANLTAFQRQLLYLTAAWIVRSLRAGS